MMPLIVRCLVPATLCMLLAAPALALNPQPEVPSKPNTARENPKALNPQPEVPSKKKKKNLKKQPADKPMHSQP